MFHRVFLTALLAGALAGIALFVAHITTTTPMILHAEVYETAAAGHSPDAPASKGETASVTKEWSPSIGFERSAYTLVADLLISIGFAFLMVGAMSMSGREVDWSKGLIWGLCGFATFVVAPAFGLAPELPGMPSSALQARQIWWIGTAVATAAGLGLIFLTELRAYKFAAVALIALPHLIGAPANEDFASNVPAILASEFAVATLVINGLFWLLLGGLAGHFYARFENQ